MRTPCRATPTSRHFPISEYRQLRGLQERLVRIDEPSHPIPVKANLIMYEQDHARTFSERSNHAAEEKKTLLAPCQNRSLGALPFARREHVARHRVCRRRPSGKRRTGERPARSSAKRALPPWQGRHSRKLIRIRQPNQPSQPKRGRGGSFDNRRRQRIRRWLRPSSWGRCRIRSGRNPGRGRSHRPKGGYRNRPEPFQSRDKRAACRQLPELREVRRDVLPRPKRHPVENVHRLRGNQEVGRHAHRG